MLFVNSATYDQVAGTFDIHGFGLDFFGYRIHEFVILPCALLFTHQLDPLFHVFLAVNIFVVKQIKADHAFLLAVGQAFGFHVINNNIKIVKDPDKEESGMDRKLAEGEKGEKGEEAVVETLRKDLSYYKQKTTDLETELEKMREKLKRYEG